MTVLGDYENVTYRHPQETRPSGRTVIRSHAVHLGSWFFVQNSVMNSFQHPGGLSENVTYRHLNLIQNLSFFHFGKNEELVFYLENGEPLNAQPVSLDLPTPNHGFSKDQILNRSASG
jgi:hypothetical protein